MAWKCPDCGKNLKRKGNHMATHEESDEIEYNAIEEYLSFGPALGGEISRLRLLRQHDGEEKWGPVYHSYAKVSKEGNFQNTRREREAVRRTTAQRRQVELW